ncbi:MAG TPA: NAD(P)-dependent oxidoreductase, partial [Rhodobacteraceae bacterium]|nr:NAD(P)-dependent oxidoreductase [Paracoccaceae bacterium]
GAARTIVARNIFGGMCARVCPTETLCEDVCVRAEADGGPVRIGELQRLATDRLIQTGEHPFTRAAATGRKVAVVGAGPAGLACAHALSRAGHDVIVFEAHEKPGGLNEYGLASYKTPDDFARREVDWLLSLGGIEVRTGLTLGKDVTLAQLRKVYDAVFLGLGLGGANRLGLENEDMEGVHDAIDYIAALRQTDDLSSLPVGRHVLVIGGGMTAIDIAVQVKKLGADDVTILYRRGPDEMKASLFERQLAQTSGVVIRFYGKPVRLVEEGGRLGAVETECTLTGERQVVKTDQLFKAIGQSLLADGLENEGLAIEHGRIRTDEQRRTSLAGVWAGGDCISGGDDLTVSAVEDGKQAAASINAFLAGEPS